MGISWQDAAVLKLETDAAMSQGDGGDCQGVSTAPWDYPQAAFAGRGGGPAPGGSLKVPGHG